MGIPGDRCANKHPKSNFVPPRRNEICGWALRRCGHFHFAHAQVIYRFRSIDHSAWAGETIVTDQKIKTLDIPDDIVPQRGVKAPPAASTPGQRGVNDHISRHLKRLFDEVVDQPIPDRFLELLNRLDEPGRDA
jgi:Anti-sigma factor NepR